MEKITIKGDCTITDVEQASDEGEIESLSIEVHDYNQVSDGYHTIAELYDHRHTLFIALCRVIQRQDDVDQQNSMRVIERVWRSKNHSDGNPAYDGWFIMGIGKEPGKQISYHLPLSRWDETDFAETLEKAPPWDGHTSQDVLKRLKNI